MNVPIKVVATRIDKKRGNVCTSRRAVLEKSKNAELKEALKNLKEGDIVENAKVKATTDWGIFLDIDGLDALLHVSDLSYGRVNKPSDLNILFSGGDVQLFDKGLKNSIFVDQDLVLKGLNEILDYNEANT